MSSAASHTTSPAGAARTGRPRRREADEAILAAAFRLLGENGYAGLTMDGVASAAGVGKPTIYRRYTNKMQLAAAAIANFLRVPETPDTGSARGDLVELVFQDATGIRTPAGATMLGTLLAEKDRNPQLLEVFRSHLMRNRERQYREVIERGTALGQLVEDTDWMLVGMMLIGSLMGGALAGVYLNRAGAERVVDMLLTGIGRREQR